MANIREIAKLAGVSVTTVSRVLNDHPYVSEEKKSAVYKAMEELNYNRNIKAIQLSKGISNMIGVVLPTIEHPYFSRIVEGIAEEAIKHHLQIVLFQTNYETSKELDALELLRGNLMDGLVFCSRAISFDTLNEYKEHGPIILCEDSDQEEFPTISIPHEQAFKFGLEYLISKGHTRIAYSLGRKEGTNSTKRRKAYENKMREINQPLRDEWFFDQCLSIKDGQQIGRKYMNVKEKPTAILVSNDQVAAGLLLEANELKLKIPEDLAVLSFDNQPISEAMHISTIEIPIIEMGRMAVTSIINSKNKTNSTDKKITLPFRLVERSTV
ncbi:DNA-binding LacI/PurR family transcriptional regulator [Bacillus pakistanensis]|uniref:DNA-binding LacI/PurR family transcriptional regulator n=1 Tax=Rossellomorea pakistanensis TaxID=992288 RepID=A0ABS2NH53_9BACI|nr:LacI family DNA-binding transcriptional regulator [Bacillus pakistanensis]MBM7587203.1 DNA-binding LacI/PurR family transcriptional regulator [Bacillus pakistanensis]